MAPIYIYIHITHISNDEDESSFIFSLHSLLKRGSIFLHDTIHSKTGMTSKQLCIFLLLLLVLSHSGNYLLRRSFTYYVRIHLSISSIWDTIALQWICVAIWHIAMLSNVLALNFQRCSYFADILFATHAKIKTTIICLSFFLNM